MKKTFALLLSALVLLGCASPREENYTVIVSLDAFRWDYPERFDTPWLNTVASKGVRAVMEPSFPASTFPNHYTLATGLYPDHHGIVNNSFWDSERSKLYSMGDIGTRSDPAFYGGEPIWTTAQRQGVRTANVYWVGSDIPIGDSLPTYYKDWYDTPRLSYEQRVRETLRLLDLPPEERPRLVMTYFDEPDMTSHGYGPLSKRTGEMVHYLDSLMGVLFRGIKALPHGDKVNLIVTADHGMTDISPERFVCIWDYLKDEWFERVVGSSPTSIFSAPACQDSIIAALRDVEHIHVWRHGELPPELHYGTNPRLGDLVIAPDTGWQFGDKARGSLGAHGYFPYDSDMQVMFVACGPSFREGYVKKDVFPNVDIYPLLARLLGVKAAENDGSISEVKDLLKK